VKPPPSVSGVQALSRGRITVYRSDRTGRPAERTFYGNGPGQRGYACSDVPQHPPGEHSRWGAPPSTGQAQARLRGRARHGLPHEVGLVAGDDSVSFTVSTIVHIDPHDCRSMQFADRPQFGRSVNIRPRADGVTWSPTATSSPPTDQQAGRVGQRQTQDPRVDDRRSPHTRARPAPGTTCQSARPDPHTAASPIPSRRSRAWSPD
jgi:hypothetical protein